MQSEKVPTRRNESFYRSVTDIYVPPFQHNTNKIEGKIDPEHTVRFTKEAFNPAPQQSAYET
jgi:hypothetical protein